MSKRHTTVIARAVTRVVVPLIVVLSIALLLQGHNRPGGGFIAGVLTCTAVALTYIVYGRAYLQAELLDRSTSDVGMLSGIVHEYAMTFAVGLGLAAGSGAAAIVFGYPFLTQGVVFLEHLPLWGSYELASAFAFDLGVYLVVVGSLLTILSVVGAE